MISNIGGDALQNLTERVSSNGSLSVDLNVVMADKTIEWLTMTRRTYNGDFPGPTWRIKPGDTVTINLVCTGPEKIICWQYGYFY